MNLDKDERESASIKKFRTNLKELEGSSSSYRLRFGGNSGFPDAHSAIRIIFRELREEEQARHFIRNVELTIRIAMTNMRRARLQLATEFSDAWVRRRIFAGSR